MESSWPANHGAVCHHPTAGVGFWLALAAALLIAGVAAYPANGWMIARGKGHAVVHRHHVHSGHVAAPGDAGERQRPH